MDPEPLRPLPDGLRWPLSHRQASERPIYRPGLRNLLLASLAILDAPDAVKAKKVGSTSARASRHRWNTGL